MTVPRAAQPTVRFIDEYCDSYKSLFPEVRSFEAFKQLHIGLVSDIKRKSPDSSQPITHHHPQLSKHCFTNTNYGTSQARISTQ